MSGQPLDTNELTEEAWAGQQRFRYFVSAVLLPLVAVLSAYLVFKTAIQLGAVTDVGVAVAILTGWNETEYWIAFLVHLCTSAAMIKCCLSRQMVVAWYVRVTLWFAVVLWLVIVGIAIMKIGLSTIAGAIIGSTLLAAFALICAVLIPTKVRLADQAKGNTTVGRFTILQLMSLTAVVAVVAAIGMKFPKTASVEFWVVMQLAGALFRIFMLGTPILACYAYFRAAFDFGTFAADSKLNGR